MTSTRNQQQIYGKHMDFLNCVNSVCHDCEGDRDSFTRLFKKHKRKLTENKQEEIAEYLREVQTKWERVRTPKMNVDCGIALLSTLDIISEVLPQVVRNAWFERRTQAAKVFGVDQFHEPRNRE